LPVRIVGLFEVKQSGRRFARPGEIEVRVGRVMRFATQSPEVIATELETVVEGL
jgi:hypothetical protein